MEQCERHQECCCGRKVEIMTRMARPHWGDEFQARLETGKENRHCRLRNGQSKSPRQEGIQHGQGNRRCPCGTEQSERGGWQLMGGTSPWKALSPESDLWLLLRKWGATGCCTKPRETKRQHTDLKWATSAIQGRGRYSDEGVALEVDWRKPIPDTCCIYRVPPIFQELW